ncbi:hypothetical protein C5C14_15515, partial [Rathayibacter rathayi]
GSRGGAFLGEERSRGQQRNNIARLCSARALPFSSAPVSELFAIARSLPRSPTEREVMSSSEHDIVVIGAGATGLTAALRLHEQGYDEGGVEVHATYAAPFWRADGLSGTAFSPYSLVHEAYDNSTHGEQHGTLVGFVSDEKADRVLALDEGERKAAILDSLAAYFGPAALDPLVYYESDWASEEWTQGAYAASFDLGGLTRYGALQLEPVGPLRLGTSDIAAEGYQHVDGAIRVGRRLAQEIIDEDAATARASHREGAQHA